MLGIICYLNYYFGKLFQVGEINSRLWNVASVLMPEIRKTLTVKIAGWRKLQSMKGIEEKTTSPGMYYLDNSKSLLGLS